MTGPDVRTTVLHNAGTDAGGVAEEVSGAFGELLAAVSADSAIPRNDDISAMIAAAYAAIHEMAAGSIASVVTALGGHGEGLTTMAATYRGTEEDLAAAIRRGAPWE
ncbi:hypothetical protein LDL08_08600 [Nonomuraea glycinis]|uniref:PE domain-containing protein n=1 Tax=Nonomuraea glycinis TaxID=2047744 RepID=A0A918E655_9ACTN|nr:hypothetical protein [Nonomuraea glycinis]MCA2176239.1 hypothetical protein [Nonomuraea glycinis]GGP07570.1 hypothetical protein GCM10012278_35870 [Nonomuraea glycinis]